MRSIEAESLKKKFKWPYLVFPSVTCTITTYTYIYITLYAIACHSHTSRKIRVYTARLKVIKRCACFKNSEVGPASVQTWLAYFVRSPLHDPVAHQ